MFVVALSLAANCCRLCQLAKEEKEKAFFASRCFCHLGEAMVSAEFDFDSGDIEEGEKEEVAKFILDFQGICAKCEREGLIYAAINNQWVAPAKEALLSVSDRVALKEKEKKEKKRRMRGLKVEGNLYRFNFKSKKRKSK